MVNSSIQPSTQSTMVACRRTILRWAMPSPAWGYQASAHRICLPAASSAAHVEPPSEPKTWALAGAVLDWSVAANNKLEGNRDS